MKVLILGVTGMLGHTLFKEMSKNNAFNVSGTTRSLNGLKRHFSPEEMSRIFGDVDSDNFDSVMSVISSFCPNIIINCIGIIKQLPIAKDPLTAITVNAQLPHRISLIAQSVGARLIHISTDCVFDGAKGSYTEEDNPTATDLYGRTKFLGEVDYPHCITLRTSIIGHELQTEVSLVDWFLSQEKEVNGFTNAIYSGISTYEMVNVISNYVIPNKRLSGVYHVSSDYISKYSLLKILKEVYKKDIVINAYDNFLLDRSMDSDKFKSITGYVAPEWYIMAQNMYEHAMREEYYKKKRI